MDIYDGDEVDERLVDDESEAVVVGGNAVESVGDAVRSSWIDDS